MSKETRHSQSRTLKGSTSTGSTSTSSRRWVAGFLLLWGAVMLLEGLQITQLGQPADNVPYWVLAVVGVVLLCAGLAALIEAPASRWKDLLAALITALMGCIGGWISLFTDESSINGSLVFLSPLLGIPLGRIVFGVGALICFLISLYAWRLFWRKSCQHPVLNNPRKPFNR